MNAGIKKLKTDKLTFKFFQTNKKDKYNKTSISTLIKLNKFLKKNNYEFDVFYCDAFLESPGEWLK